MRWLIVTAVLLLSGCVSYPFSPYNMARASCVWHHGNDPRCDYPAHMADGRWQVVGIPTSDYTPLLHDNCPGEFPCGGQAAAPVFDPVPLPQFAPVAAPDLEPMHVRVDQSGQFDGSAPRSNCPGIMLPGTNVCGIPVGPDGR